MIHREYYTAIIKDVHFVKQARAAVFTQLSYVLRAVSVHLFIFIFLIPVGTLHRGRTTGQWAREGERRARRDTVELPWRFTLLNKRLVSGR